MVNNLFQRIDTQIVYPIILKNQEKLQRSVNRGALASRGESSYDIVSKYQGVGKEIYEFLYTFRNLPFIKLKNETIAQKVNCAKRTVQRWTKRFEKDGLISTSQTNQYDVNQFTIHLTKRQAYTYHLNTLSLGSLNELTTHGTIGGNDPSTTFLYRGVTQSYSYINNYSYKTNPYPLTRAREKMGTVQEKKENKQKARVVRGIQMLQEEQRKWIGRNRNEPNMRKTLESEPLNSLIFTQPLEELAQLVSFNEREKLKLVAFPDEAVLYARDAVKRVVTGAQKITKPVNDVVGWVMGIATAYCKDHNLNPEWQWYFDLCHILKIEALRKEEAPRALDITVSRAPRRSSFGKQEEKIDRTSKSYIKATEWKPDPKSIRVNLDRVEELEAQIVHLKKVLENPSAYYASFVLEHAIKGAQNNLKFMEEKLKQLCKGSA